MRRRELQKFVISVLQVQLNNPTNSLLLTQRAWRKVDEIEGRIEELIEETHEAEHGAIGVVNMHNWIFAHVDEFVGGFALQNCSTKKSKKHTSI